MKASPPADTVILQSHYYTPGAAVLAAFPVVLRAGHLRAAIDYAVDRRSSVGHDLLFCLAGAGIVRVRGKKFSVQAGELVWINGYEPHAHQADPHDPWELFWLRMEGPGLEALHRLLGADRNPVFRFDDVADTRTCFRRILRRMAGPVLNREDDIHIHLARLVTLLRRSRHSTDSPGNREIPKEMAAVINRMSLYPQQSWSATALARMAGMSVPSFYRSFRQITGSAPVDWLRRERINLAKRRLLESDDPIKTVAEQTGYNCPFYFSRDFKRHSGYSPTEFRRQERHSY